MITKLTFTVVILSEATDPFTPTTLIAQIR